MSQHGKGWKGPLWIGSPASLLDEACLGQAVLEPIQAGFVTL